MTREIENLLCSAISVRALRDELEGLPDNHRVLFVCDYGDYGGTQQALQVSAVREIMDHERIVDSPYSRSQLALVGTNDEPDECDLDDTEEQDVVILSMECL